MKQIGIFGALWCFSVAANFVSVAAAGGDGLSLLNAAKDAEMAGVPEVSIVQIREFLLSAPDPIVRSQAETLLARCLIETRNTDEALSILEHLRDPEARFLEAQAFYRLHDWERAETAFTSLLSYKELNSAIADQAHLGLAACLQAQGETQAALETLQPILNEPQAMVLAAQIYLEQNQTSKAESLLSKLNNPNSRLQLEKLCLEGQIALQRGELEFAQDHFQSVLGSREGRTYRVMALAQLGMINILRKKNDLEQAEDEAEKLIADQPRSSLLPEMFDVLFGIYSEEKVSNPSECVQWASENPAIGGPDRPPRALFCLARLQMNQDLSAQAQQSLKDLIKRFPDHPVTSDGMLMLAEMYLENEDWPEATAILQKLIKRPLASAQYFQAYSDLGEALFREGNAAKAKEAFLHLASRSDHGKAEALYNASVCTLQAGLMDEFQQLSKQALPRDYIGKLLFSKGLIEARSGNRNATRTLQSFLVQFPDHPEAAQALVLEAELKIMAQPPDLPGANKALEAAASNPALQEQIDRLKFFSAAADPESKIRQIEPLAEAYLQKYPNTLVRPEIRMKLGELYFRESDFPNAQTQFELVQEENPDSPMVEASLFLAGEAARNSLNPASIDRAITLFEEVYKLDGALKLQARLEQALALRQTHQEHEAIALLNDLLAQNPPADVRCEALDNKGEAQFNLASKNPELYPQAMQTFEKLIDNQDVPVAWRQEGLYQKAKCLEKLGQSDAALAAYYDVLAINGDRGNELWFFRAGFDAAQMLEQRRSWASAAAVYQKLASTKGARSEEAQHRLTQLRLEHFLWPD
ncbi:MAG: tetratricopeptide repeat protein [Verrucomicrobia bacterium]|nr:tetratricopeptide repeat protein [Verrucomicrobiota bacterium]